MSEVRAKLEQALDELDWVDVEDRSQGSPSKVEALVREALALLDASGQEQTDGIVSAFEAVQRAITEAVGDGAPSGPYWEDGVRLLQQRAEKAEADLTALKAEALPDGWLCKNVGECMAALRDIEHLESTEAKLRSDLAALRAQCQALVKKWKATSEYQLGGGALPHCVAELSSLLQTGQQPKEPLTTTRTGA